ncbi:MAG TPA: hypothetical protein VKQ72_21420 [Aggregatilineales bacterium]|nr:hypothetical protein [Aggregatilineales bacterium]
MPQLTRRKFLGLSLLSALGMASPLLSQSSTSAAPFKTQTLTPTASPFPPATKSMRGLFALMDANDVSISDELLAVPYLTGVTLQIDWATLQPSQTIVAWDAIQNALTRLRAVSKVLALRPLAGIGSPDWLYASPVNAKKFTFTPASDRLHPLPYGKPVTMPLPWDKAMLAAWTKFVKALGDQFDTEPKLVRVALSGPVFQAAEMYLPHYAPLLGEWNVDGYNLGSISDAWEQTIDIYAGAFKKTPFTLDVNPLPDPQDRTGDTLNSVIPIAIGSYGLRRYPGRFFNAQSDFSDVFPYLAPPLPGPLKPPALYESYEMQDGRIYDYIVGASKDWPFGLTVSQSMMSHATDRIQALVERAKLLKTTYLEIPAAWAIDPANADALQNLFTL